MSAMARTDPHDFFSFSELARAAGISKGAFQLIHCSPGLLQGGRGIEDFKRMATIGAYMACGLPLIAAAGIAKTIIHFECNEEDGEAPTGLKFLALSLTKKSRAQLPIHANDYWYHLGLFRQGSRPGRQAFGSDKIIEIVDRRFVFARSGLKVMNSITGKPEEASLVGWLEGWQRGLEPQLTHLFEVINLDQHPEKQFGQLNTEAQNARDNAVGKSTVNISLAIRRALDRLFEQRGVSSADVESSPAPAPAAEGALSVA